MKKILQKWRGRSAALLLVASTLATQAVTEVKTIGGGPNQSGPGRAGANDGDTFAYAKFRNPYAIAVGTNGDLIIADQGNKKLRIVSNPGAADSLTSTFVSKLPSPVGVAVDGANAVYVVTKGDGKLRKYSIDGVLLQTISGFRSPSALGLGSNGVIYVSELRGNIYRAHTNGTTELIASGFRAPRGLAVLANGLVAVTESTGHAVQLLDPESGISTLIAGGTGKGLLDGPGPEAKFNSPFGIAVAPNGSLVVADKLNHRLRVIDTNYIVSTLYGVPRNQWSHQFAGWVDGDSSVAASHDPVGLAVNSAGTVYVSEIFWDLLRQATGTGLGLTNASNSDTNTDNGGMTNLLAAPTFFPNYGYFPFGVSITVTSAAPVYYTTDGTEPTTNSHSITLAGNTGSFRFSENLRDLTSLRLKAISADGASVTVGGKSAPNNEIGIPRNFTAGSGATLLVPIVANLRTNARIQSFQYVVEIEPQNGAPEILPYLRASSISENDFVPLVTSAASGKIAHYIAQPDPTATRYMVVSASGTNANVDFQNFATTTLLVVPIDPSTPDGSTYTIRVRQPSATSDGNSADVPVIAGPMRTITIASTPYLVGDVATGGGYNAGEFGDFDLKNNDANAVLYASVGIRVPFPFTDAFNAMDAHPPEPGGIGDGDVDYSDWQVVLNRSLRLDLNNWTRTWFNGGLQSDPVPLVAAAPVKKSRAKLASVAKSDSANWSRGATLVAGNMYNQGGYCEVPVSIKVAPGQAVGGLAFRAIVESEGSAPAVTDVSFTPLMGNSGFVTAAGLTRNEIVCAWSMVPSSPFTPKLQGNNLLGHLTFTIPGNAGTGQHYTIRFLKPSGAKDLSSTVTFEGIPGSSWVNMNPGTPGRQTSDEWRVNYFQSTDAPVAADNADPDGDGMTNAQEYLNGTDPTNPLSL